MRKNNNIKNNEWVKHVSLIIYILRRIHFSTFLHHYHAKSTCFQPVFNYYYYYSLRYLLFCVTHTNTKNTSCVCEKLLKGRCAVLIFIHMHMLSMARLLCNTEYREKHIPGACNTSEFFLATRNMALVAAFVAETNQTKKKLFLSCACFAAFGVIKKQKSRIARTNTQTKRDSFLGKSVRVWCTYRKDECSMSVDNKNSKNSIVHFAAFPRKRSLKHKKRQSCVCARKAVWNSDNVKMRNNK